MSKFVPPKSIREIQMAPQYHPDRISEEGYKAIAGAFERISSENPEVSVVIIAHNEEENILRTLASLSKTECKFPIEFIVVDNNSDDRTKEIIEKCGVRYVFENVQGIAIARQSGTEAARGHFIVSGDADTLYTKKWAELLAAPLKNSKVTCAYSLHAFYAEDDTYPFGLKAYQNAKTLGVKYRHLKRPHLNCGGASMAFSKRGWEKIGGYDLKLQRGEDGLLAFQLSKIGRIEKIEDPKAMIYTSMRRTDMDGNLAKAFWVRAKRYFKNAFRYMSSQKE